MRVEWSELTEKAQNMVVMVVWASSSERQKRISERNEYRKEGSSKMALGMKRGHISLNKL